ncbi:MAG: beta-ketoacyl-ACP synthase III [Candidatus Bipolaricaulaceae bacterium]
MLRVRVTGTGAFLPERRLTNENLAHMVDTSDEWIRSRTGIRERRLLDDGAAAADMGVRAGQAALAAARREPGEVDLLLVATNVPERIIPGSAPYVAAGLGLEHDAPFFDLKAGCAGFVYGVAVAGGYLEAGLARSALVIGVEALSRIVDWEDRRTCVLFGDGAGAALLEPSSGEAAILGVALYGDPSKAHLLTIEAGGVGLPTSAETVRRKQHYLKMEGEGVFRTAVPMMEQATREALRRSGLSPGDVDWLIPHQANLRIINPLARRLSIPRERVVVNIDRAANTSTASIPIALDELVRAGRLRAGQVVAMTAFGAGACYGTAIIKW